VPVERVVEKVVTKEVPVEVPVERVVYQVRACEKGGCGDKIIEVRPGFW
jgi:hypothetical protein